jgi:cytochrome c peroxidase
MLKKMTLTACVLATSVMADSLADQAKAMGLAPIPENTLELYKMIDNPKNPMTAAKVELGKKLFFDPRLSKSELISCNTCHNLATGGVDGVPAAIGHKWRHNPHHLNSPSVYNAVFMQKQFWDGRSPDLEDQAQGPMQAAPEMAAKPEHVTAVVNSIPEYVREFRRAYGDPKMEPKFKDVADVIAVFERTLVTPSRYDKYLSGCDKALSKEEKAGLKTFIDKGCVSCHNGVGLGGGMQVFPLIGKFKYMNVGDFKGDANGMVKVPTLRNVVETAPYFHNGTVWSLKETIKIMGETQLGVKLTDKETESIETFLKALTGDKPEVEYPVLPARTAKTPLPDSSN